jgi:hypothetical protein
VAEKQKYKIVEVPGVPETYANQFISGGFDGSSISINLGTARLIPQRMGDVPEGAVPQVYVTTRLMMSVPAAMEMVRQLSGMMEQMGLKMPGSAQGQAAPPSGGGWMDQKN